MTEAQNVGTIMHAPEHYVKNEEYKTGNNIVHRQAAMAQEVINNIEPDLDEAPGSEVNPAVPKKLIRRHN